MPIRALGYIPAFIPTSMHTLRLPGLAAQLQGMGSKAPLVSGSSAKVRSMIWGLSLPLTRSGLAGALGWAVERVRAAILSPLGSPACPSVSPFSWWSSLSHGLFLSVSFCVWISLAYFSLLLCFSFSHFL